MKLDELNLSMVNKAVETYLSLAYGSGDPPRARADLQLPPDAPTNRILELFQREVVEESGRSCARYTMRLGNRNYPFMKLLLQEHIVPGEFFFGVDTHDDMGIKPDFPDYEAWMQVRRFNQDLKRRIEAEFAARGLSTSSQLRDLVAARGGCDADACRGGTVLIVDDEQDLAETVDALLSAQGYRTRCVADGASALQAARELRPDLILLDYELPEMDGLEVIRELRGDPATRDVPVLLCTASKIGVGDIRKADGFLAKPYQEELLYQMVQHVMGARREAGS